MSREDASLVVGFVSGKLSSYVYGRFEVMCRVHDVERCCGDVKHMTCVGYWMREIRTKFKGVLNL